VKNSICGIAATHGKIFTLTLHKLCLFKKIRSLTGSFRHSHLFAQLFDFSVCDLFAALDFFVARLYVFGKFWITRCAFLGFYEGWFLSIPLARKITGAFPACERGLPVADRFAAVCPTIALALPIEPVGVRFSNPFPSCKLPNPQNTATIRVRVRVTASVSPVYRPLFSSCGLLLTSFRFAVERRLLICSVCRSLP